MWFVLDNALILPEYLVEFDYTTTKNDEESDKENTAEPETQSEFATKLFSYTNEA